MSNYDPEAFANPPMRYRPLQIVHGFDRYLKDKEALTGEEGVDQHLERLLRLGVGGVVANVGFKDYLQSDRQWEIYRHGMRKADELGMVLWLYDEKGYPSGSAGGLVVRANPDHAAQGLACLTMEARGGVELFFDMPVSCREFIAAHAWRKGEVMTASNAVDLKENVDEWSALRWTPPEGEWVVVYFARRTAFEGSFATTIPGHTDTRMYIDVLNPEAVRSFIRVTHRQYRRQTPEDLWSRVQAIFTDEPLLLAPYVGTMPADRPGEQFILDQPLFLDRPIMAPWTARLPEVFQKWKGYDLRPFLYAIFTGESDEACQIRQDYWEVVSRLYAESFHQQIADWCAANGIASSGHVLAEEGLYGNIMFQGSLFAAIRPMQLPGIDILSANPREVADKHAIVAKMVSSIAHWSDRELVQCETSSHNQRTSGIKLGPAEWRAQGNMLYAMGVNVLTLYHHWSQVGEEEYRKYNDYMARLASMLTGGSHVCHVAVLYPIRSGWGVWVPHASKTVAPPTGPALPAPLAGRLGAIDNSYQDASRGLVREQIDFDFVDERAIQEARMEDGAMRLADEAYRVLVLAGVWTLETKTLRALEAFVEAGGRVVFLDRSPGLASSALEKPEFDASLKRLLADGDKTRVVPAARMVATIRGMLGLEPVLAQANPDVYFTHRRRDGRDILFFASNLDTPTTLQARPAAPGPWKVYRPMNGKVEDAPADLVLKLEAYEGVILVNEGPAPKQ